MMKNVCPYKDWEFPDPLNAYQQFKENLHSILVVSSLVKECKPEQHNNLKKSNEGTKENVLHVNIFSSPFLSTYS
jgi:hypothetical protein